MNYEVICCDLICVTLVEVNDVKGKFKVHFWILFINFRDVLNWLSCQSKTVGDGGWGDKEGGRGGGIGREEGNVG